MTLRWKKRYTRLYVRERESVRVSEWEECVCVSVFHPPVFFPFQKEKFNPLPDAFRTWQIIFYPNLPAEPNLQALYQAVFKYFF